MTIRTRFVRFRLKLMLEGKQIVCQPEFKLGGCRQPSFATGRFVVRLPQIIPASYTRKNDVI